MDYNKQEAIKVALSKLSQEEINLLEIDVVKLTTTKTFHQLTVNYMIGDGDGYDYETRRISLDNPFLKDVLIALDKLNDGDELCENTYDDLMDNDLISKYERDLLYVITNYNTSDEELVNKFISDYVQFTDDDKKYLREFDGLLSDYNGEHYLSFEYYEID